MKNGCILCGGVGSGKSRTALAYYYICNGGSVCDKYVKMKEPKNLYIITTARKRDTLEWEDELKPFLLYPNNIYKNSVIIDSWNNIKKYKDVTNSFFIFDEQRVVGYGAWSKTFIKITKSNEWILLSATPGDTWQDYIPVFIANGFFKNKAEFERNHAIYDRYSKYPRIDRYVNTGLLIKYRNSILINMDFERPTTEHHENVVVNFSKEKYRDIQKNRWNIFKDKPIENASELCYCLRKVVNQDVSRSVAVLEIFEKHPKVIIFYNFNYELEILRDLYYGKDVVIAEWNGKKHEQIPKSDSWVYLVQYTSGAEGWNCIETDTIIFYSQNYSYRIMEQAAGRINRLNTPYKDLYYYHLKSYSTIDIAISRALQNKKNFNNRKFVNKYFKE